MIVCFQCDARLKRQMDALMCHGGYRDYSELIAVAVANLEAMHTKLGSDLSYVFPDTQDRAPDPTPQLDSADAENLYHPDEDAPPSAPISSDVSKVPALFRLQETHDAAERIASLLADEGTESPSLKTPEQRPVSQWIFGQFNRLLPLVATTRALVQLIAESNGSIDIKDASMTIAAEALTLGEYLSKVDKELSIPRDLSYATAFPHKRKGHQKAVLRFANQFVGEITGSGVLNGLPTGYKFLTKVESGQNDVMLTKPALEFSLIENPALDKARFQDGERLSTPGARFLVDHIINHVPAERQSFMFLIKAIQSGVDTPPRLDELIIQNSALMKSERRASDAFVSSQRSGAIARMCDLKLVERHRNGVRASYAVTNDGLSFLGTD